MQADFEKLVSQVTKEVSRRLHGGQLPVLGNHKCDNCTETGACASACPTDTFQILDTGAARVSGLPGMGSVERGIARTIDHTALKPNTTQSQIELLCAEAAKYGFVSVCINPFWIPLAKQLLSQHAVKVCTVVGFPLGAMSTATKAMETRQAVEDGADEIDMVINVGALKSGYIDVVEKDIPVGARSSR